MSGVQTCALPIYGKTGEFKPINPPSGPQTVINNMVPGDPSLQTPSQSNTAIAGDTIWKAAKAARDAANMTSLGATGIPGAVLGAIDPTSSAAEVKRQISVLQANASISALIAMRAASRTGASGLGSLTEREADMLKAKAGALDPNAGSDRFKVQLDDYERTLFRTVYGQKNGDFIFEKTRDGTSPLDVVIPTNAGVASGKADYSAMNEDQLLAIDPKTLSFADRAQYIDRLDAIMAGMK